ncbi:hypothetical protein [Allosphingosinicella indica]|uniref:Secreted protein n=1 Tax=Allosphingosinicella indica TaxID=941907 RepID=A0A1X7FZG5_9SPHN|nr:hypothetical protein [Allosphingosinicella indica]SMF61406.1 hypothetical protein SAMN06295910_0392 [Allosphingosinicella indica]
MRGMLILAVAATAALGAPALAQSGASNIKTGEKMDSDKVICRKVEPATGSRLGSKRVCATAREWAQADERSREARQDIDKLQQQRAVNGQ